MATMKRRMSDALFNRWPETVFGPGDVAAGTSVLAQRGLGQLAVVACVCAHQHQRKASIRAHRVQLQSNGFGERIAIENYRLLLARDGMRHGNLRGLLFKSSERRLKLSLDVRERFRVAQSRPNFLEDQVE